MVIVLNSTIRGVLLTHRHAPTSEHSSGTRHPCRRFPPGTDQAGRPGHRAARVDHLGAPCRPPPALGQSRRRRWPGRRGHQPPSHLCPLARAPASGRLHPVARRPAGPRLATLPPVAHPAAGGRALRPHSARHQRPQRMAHQPRPRPIRSLAQPHLRHRQRPRIGGLRRALHQLPFVHLQRRAAPLHHRGPRTPGRLRRHRTVHRRPF